jgi:hypothetical protein
MKCLTHGIELIYFCPACRGQVTTKRKAAASRNNGLLGGRPKGAKNKIKPKTKEGAQPGKKNLRGSTKQKKNNQDNSGRM